MTIGDLPPGTLLLSPDTCTIDDIPDCGSGDAVSFPIAACQRCGFQFPIVPGIFRQVTITAMQEHGCSDGQRRQKWEAAAKAIAEDFTRLGVASMAELAQHLRDEQQGAAAEGEKLTLRHDAKDIIDLERTRIDPETRDDPPENLSGRLGLDARRTPATLSRKRIRTDLLATGDGAHRGRVRRLRWPHIG